MEKITEQMWKQCLYELHELLVSIPETSKNDNFFKRIGKLLNRYENGERTVTLFNELNDIMRGAK